MRVLMFGWEAPPLNSGGLGVATVGLVRALSEAGIEVTLVLPRTGTILPLPASVRVLFADQFLAPLDEEALDLWSSYSGPTYQTKRSASKPGAYAHAKRPRGRTLLDEVEWYGEAARIIAHSVPHDIIHAHDWLSYLAGIAAKEESGKPLIVHVHATEFDRTAHGQVNQHVYDIERFVMHAADHVCTVSQYTKDLVVRHYGVPAGKITVTHNGIYEDDITVCTANLRRLDAFRRAGFQIVLFVGRLTIQKGPDHFIDVAKGVLAHKPHTMFFIAGSGDMERQIIQKAAYEGISDHVVFCGFLRGQELGEMIQAADVFLMPSVSEPFGLVPLEVLMNGTPVIVSRQSGVSEVLSHALKADFWDHDDMIDKVIACLEYPTLRGHLAEEGGREARAQGWHKAAHTCKNIYGKIHDMFS